MKGWNFIIRLRLSYSEFYNSFFKDMGERIVGEERGVYGWFCDWELEIIR